MSPGGESAILPAAHGTQDVLGRGVYVPSEQYVQLVIPVDGAILPEEHVEQDEDPSVLLYFPLSHGVQSVERSVE